LSEVRKSAPASDREGGGTLISSWSEKTRSNYVSFRLRHSATTPGPHSAPSASYAARSGCAPLLSFLKPKTPIGRLPTVTNNFWGYPPCRKSCAGLGCGPSRSLSLHSWHSLCQDRSRAF